MPQLDVGAVSPADADADGFFELSYPTPRALRGQHEWVDSSTLDQLRRDVEQLQDLVTRQQQRAERHTGTGSRADSSLGASRPESPKADAAALRLPYDVRLLQGRVAAAGEAPPRPWGEASLRQAEAAGAPPDQPRVLDLTVPSLEQPPGAVGTASPLRLLRRPRNVDDSEGGDSAAALLRPPAVAVPLSEEAQALKQMFEVRVAAVESRLQAALGEVLRESANLRLAVPAHTASAAPAGSHGQPASWREEVLESDMPHRGDARPVPGTRAAVALTPFSAADTDAVCVSRAEADDPFVVLLIWATDRPARLADILGEAVEEGSASLTRRSLNALVRDTLVPGIDARGLRHVNLVLDGCQAQPGVASGDGSISISAFVAAIREGATAGASARATFHAPMAELMDRLAKSMDTHSQAWAFTAKCLPGQGGAFTATQLVHTAAQLLPGGLLPRHRALLAALAHADASFGGPRHVFTLQQARQLCVPRHDRVAARKRVLAARVAYEHGARAPAGGGAVDMPLHPRPPPPPYMVEPPPRHATGEAASSVSAAEQAALRQFAAAAAAAVTCPAEHIQFAVAPATTQPPAAGAPPHVARATASEPRDAEVAKEHGPSPGKSRHRASPRHKSSHHGHHHAHHHHNGVTSGAGGAHDMGAYALPPPGQEPKHQSIEQWLRTGGTALAGGEAQPEAEAPQQRAARSSSGVSGRAAAIIQLQAAAAMAARIAVDAAAVRNEITIGLADAGKVATRLKGGKAWH